MATVTQRPAPVKPERRAHLRRTPDGNVILHLTLTTPRVRLAPKVEEFSYVLREVPVETGRAFELRKLTPGYEVYHLLMDITGDTCDCKGGTAHGKCKHRDALIGLEKAGRLVNIPAVV